MNLRWQQDGKDYEIQTINGKPVVVCLTPEPLPIPEPPPIKKDTRFDHIETKMVYAKDGKTPLMTMVKIPAGKFIMGSDANDPARFSEEPTTHTAYLDEFWIGQTPVTNRMWKIFLDESGFEPESSLHDGDYLNHWEKDKNGNWIGPEDTAKWDHPVTYVSQLCAVEFAKFYDMALPTEQQWEKAARGTDGYRYPWGNDEPTAEHCNFNGNVGDTTPVTAYEKGRSPYGLYDVVGNTWEWTSTPC